MHGKVSLESACLIIIIHLSVSQTRLPYCWQQSWIMCKLLWTMTHKVKQYPSQDPACWQWGIEFLAIIQRAFNLKMGQRRDSVIPHFLHYVQLNPLMGRIKVVVSWPEMIFLCNRKISWSFPQGLYWSRPLPLERPPPQWHPQWQHSFILQNSTQNTPFHPCF